MCGGSVLLRGASASAHDKFDEKIEETEECHDDEILVPAKIVDRTSRIFTEIIEGKRTAEANHPVGEQLGRDECTAGRGE